MIDDLIFFTDVQNFDEIKEYLMNEQGLVKAKRGLTDSLGANSESDSFLEKYVVWEDHLDVGRFRVKFIDEHPMGSLVYWRYWGNRINEDVREQDPMKQIAKETYEKFSNLIRQVVTTPEGTIVDATTYFT